MKDHQARKDILSLRNNLSPLWKKTANLESKIDMLMDFLNVQVFIPDSTPRLVENPIIPRKKG